MSLCGRSVSGADHYVYLGVVMSKYNKRWTREEILVALDLYLKMPFSKVSARNETIIEVAKKLGRTPASLSMKMGNLAWYDPDNPSSLASGSKLDGVVWQEFAAAPDKLAREREQVLAALEAGAMRTPTEEPLGITGLSGGEERAQHNKRWTREETLVAFSLYWQIPFKKVNNRNEIITVVAEKLGRTSSSLSMKMGNLAWHDPNNPSSLASGSKVDKEIWQEFFASPEKLMYESEQAYARLEGDTVEEHARVPPDIAGLPDGEERERLVRIRVNQSLFRRAVLVAYGGRCCITGLGEPEVLNASHIKPWRECEVRERLLPSNGLCLNALHDRAFDRGLITVSPDGIILISDRLREATRACDESAFVVGWDGGKIQMPDKFEPGKEFLEYHNRNIFVGA